MSGGNCFLGKVFGEGAIFCEGGQFSSGAIVFGGNCPGGNYSGGNCPGAIIRGAIVLEPLTSFEVLSQDNILRNGHRLKNGLLGY